MENSAVFVDIDFSQSKSRVSLALESYDIETANETAHDTMKVQTEIEKNAKSVGGKVVFESSMNLMLYVPFDEELIESFGNAYSQVFGEEANIGVGKTPMEAHESLAVVDGEDSGNIVLSSAGIMENLVQNRAFYKQAKKGVADLDIDKVIKRALLELNIITTDQKVYDIFLALIRKSSLNTIEEMQAFFFKPLEELKTEIREVYQHVPKTAMYPEKVPFAPGDRGGNKGRRQKSPYKKMNWTTREEYSPNVDWSKTDVQYVGGNLTSDSNNFSMGGEPGESIAVSVVKRYNETKYGGAK